MKSEDLDDLIRFDVHARRYTIEQPQKLSRPAEVSGLPVMILERAFGRKIETVRVREDVL